MIILEIHEINSLCDSNIKPISRVGWYLYNLNNTEEGLSEEQLKDLISTLSSEVKYIDAQMEDDLDKMYDKGYQQAEDDCCCCQ